MKNYIKLMRPKHYLKNFLVFLPLFFSGNLLDVNKLLCTAVGFFSFCMMASTIYIINDILDLEKDKLHPLKKNRPIASGKVSVRSAIVLAVVTLLMSIALSALLTLVCKSFMILIFIILYFIINLAYSFKLKKIPLLDIATIVICFIIRLLYGASITNIIVSNWMLLTIISIAFYLALGKRRNEIIKNGSASREVLQFYSLDFLDKNMYLCLTLAITFYSLWCFQFDNKYLIWTVPIVIMTCMKYNMVLEEDSFGDPTDVICNSKAIFALLSITIVILLISLYA